MLPNLSIITGHMGSGKSMIAAQIGVAEMLRGRSLRTNLGYRWEPWTLRGKPQIGLREYLARRGYEIAAGSAAWQHIDDAGIDVLEKIASPGSTIIIDECLDYIGSDTRSQARWMSLVRHFRKIDVRLILIAQSWGHIDKRMRVLCERLIICRNMAAERIPIMRMPVPPPLRWYIVAQHYGVRQGHLMPGQDARQYLWRYDPIRQTYATDHVHFSLDGIGAGAQSVGVQKDGDVMTTTERGILIATCAGAVVAAVSSGIAVAWAYRTPPPAPQKEATQVQRPAAVVERILKPPTEDARNVADAPRASRHRMESQRAAAEMIAAHALEGVAAIEVIGGRAVIGRSRVTGRQTIIEWPIEDREDK